MASASSGDDGRIRPLRSAIRLPSIRQQHFFRTYWELRLPALGLRLPGPDRPLRPEEARVLLLLGILGCCGTLQLTFAVTIPNVPIGVLGLVVVTCSYLLAREVWLFRRTKHLLYGVFQPLPLVFVSYTDYVKLAEALDEDEVTLATEDDLERSVQKNLEDRVSAYAGVFVDCLVVIVSFLLAEAVLALRRAYIGEIKDDAPWVVQILGGSHASLGDTETRRTGRDAEQQRRGSLGNTDLDERAAANAAEAVDAVDGNDMSPSPALSPTLGSSMPSPVIKATEGSFGGLFARTFSSGAEAAAEPSCSLSSRFADDSSFKAKRFSKSGMSARGRSGSPRGQGDRNRADHARAKMARMESASGAPMLPPNAVLSGVLSVPGRVRRSLADRRSYQDSTNEELM